MEAIEGTSYGGRGGRREGAGRKPGKPNREKYADLVDIAEGSLASHLPDYAGNVDKIACGLNSGWKETWVAAGTVTIKRVLYHHDLEGRCTWQPYQDRNGKPIEAEQAAFPHLLPTDLVCIKREVINEGRDLKANIYALDRIAGKAATNTNESVEFDPDTVLDALSQIGDLVEAFVTDPDAQTKIAKRLRGIAESLSQTD